MVPEVAEFAIGWRLELLKALSDPNIAYVLMTLGTIGLLAELYNPGAIVPGIVGAISLILGFYSLQFFADQLCGPFALGLGCRLVCARSHGYQLWLAGDRRCFVHAPGGR